jgi:uncharacterized protein YxeA
MISFLKMKKIIKKYIARLFGISAACDAFEEAFKLSKDRQWDYFFVAIDLHKTVLKPDYDKMFVTEFYDHAERVLKAMSERGDMTLIMYTCSHPNEINKYLELFKSRGINFQYVNENTDPNISGTDYGDFTGKPYMNVLLEDKAGFDAEEDWIKIEKLLKKYPKNYLK